MSEKYIISVDGGSQSTKVTIFDTKGNSICHATQRLRPTIARKPGWVEHPDDDLWDSLVVASQAVMKKFQGDPKDIIGLGLCTIRCCRVFVKADGTLADPVMSWMDIRSYKPFAEFPPETKYVTTTTGYMTTRLTGNFYDTAATCIFRQWPIDTTTWDWSVNPADFEKFNLKREQMYELKMPGEIVGYLTAEAAAALHLPEGLPVVATSNDKAVEGLGAGVMSGGIGLVSLGTYIASMTYGDRDLGAMNNFYTNMASVPHKFLYESGGVRRGMWTVSWFKDLLGDEIALKAKERGISPEQLLDEEAEKIPAGSEGLLTIPEWLMPTNLAYKKGIIMGFDTRHGRAHIHRSIMEGIALTMKTKYDAMCQEMQAPPSEQIIISGGGSNGDVFMQIFADVFGIPSVRNVVNDAAALGSAICVAVAAGVYGSFEEACAAMIKIRDTFYPNEKNHRVYTQINEEVFSKVSATNDALFLKLSQILEE